MFGFKRKICLGCYGKKTISIEQPVKMCKKCEKNGDAAFLIKEATGKVYYIVANKPPHPVN